MNDILQVTCDEPAGQKVHTVRKMILTPDNLYTFWEKTRHFKVLFSHEIRGDFKLFLEVFLRDGPNGVESNGLFWVIDDFLGVFYITDIVPGIDANCHFTFFDRLLLGREGLVREMLKYGFERYKFRRLTTEVAMYAASKERKTSALIRFIERVGFVNEGRKRKAVQFNNEWFDVSIYGILREDV